MIDFEVKGLKIEVSPNNIKIYNSYKIKKKKEMKECITEILYKAPLYNTKRSINSLVREWRTHNIFYNRGWFLSHTKDCDLESNEKLYRRFFYYIIGRF